VITDEVIVAAVKLSERYITDRFLPDKAIDVIDEAGARARLATQVPPPDVAELKKQLEELAEKDEAIRDQDFERAAELRDRERDLQRRSRSARRSGRRSAARTARRSRRRTSAFIVSRWTGIPVTRLKEAETARLIHMEDELHKRVVGQDKAIKAIARAIRRSPRRAQGPEAADRQLRLRRAHRASVRRSWRARWRSSSSPTEDALIRVDMSEYMEKFSVSRLIGAPPGYVGYEDSGTLTKAVRHKPYSVVLLDEIEKAHPDVFNILLQVLDEGHLTDNYGRVIDFKNTVVIMTSNLGARDIGKGKGLGFHLPSEQTQFEVMEAKVNEEINRAFNPEFINRLDDIIVFHPLTPRADRADRPQPARDVQKRLTEERLTLKLTDEAVDFLIEHGYDEKFGARPIKRAIQKLPGGPALGEDPPGGVLARRRDRGRGDGGRDLAVVPGAIVFQDVMLSKLPRLVSRIRVLLGGWRLFAGRVRPGQAVAADAGRRRRGRAASTVGLVAWCAGTSAWMRR
jgi:ATP-dependent Clp protease ATP-binding subunit ClpC